VELDLYANNHSRGLEISYRKTIFMPTITAVAWKLVTEKRSLSQQSPPWLGN
jgi:hypothetical protein